MRCNNFSSAYGPYEYGKPFMYPSPHSNYLIVDENIDGINESHWNRTGHKVMNMINTSLLKENGSGAYASVPTYCLDAIYGEAYTHQFRRVNLEDAEYT